MVSFPQKKIPSRTPSPRHLKITLRSCFDHTSSRCRRSQTASRAASAAGDALVGESLLLAEVVVGGVRSSTTTNATAHRHHHCCYCYCYGYCYSCSCGYGYGYSYDYYYYSYSPSSSSSYGCFASGSSGDGHGMTGTSRIFMRAVCRSHACGVRGSFKVLLPCSSLHGGVPAASCPEPRILATERHG